VDTARTTTDPNITTPGRAVGTVCGRAGVGCPWRRLGWAAVLNRCMLSLAEISDRLEIQQLMVDYSTAIDQRRFDDLDKVFTPDAYIDYRATGGIDGHYPEVKEWLAQVLPNFRVYAHMLGNFSVRIDGDTASSRVICFNPSVLAGDNKQVLFVGLWYDDEFVRTPDGWRMTRRVETRCFKKVL
jgi:SnoaL-like domain